MVLAERVAAAQHVAPSPPSPPMRLTALLILLAPLWAAAQTPTPTPAPTPVERLQALIAQRPEDGTLRYYLAIRLAGAGQDDAALQELRRAGELVRGLLPLSAEHFRKLQEHSAYRELYASLEARLPRVADAPVFARLADASLMPEGLAYDPVDRRSFVTSMAKGSVWVLDEQGQARPFLPEQAAPLLGAVVDPASRRLHLVRSNGFLQDAQQQRVNRIESYALPSGEAVAAVDLPEATQLNDVCLGPAGVLFASDSAGGRIWRIENGRAQALEAAIPGVNGLAYDAQRQVLFAAHSTGIARLPLKPGEPPSRLALPAQEQAAAIDGLYLVAGDLVGIQNVTNPGRVLRLQLDAEGRRVLALQTLQSHHHAEMDEPTTGAVAGGVLRLLATTQVSRLQPDGSIAGNAPVKPAVLIDVPLSPK